MYTFLKGMAQLIYNVAVLPVEVIKDVVTLGGKLTRQDEMYTKKRIYKIEYGIAASVIKEIEEIE